MNVSLLAYTKGVKSERPEDIALTIAQVPYRTESPTALRSALEHGHLSILEHISFTFRIEDLSRVSQQQLTRHRMASYTIQSERHTSPTRFVVPESCENILRSMEKQSLSNSLSAMYDYLISMGIPKEDARFFLPQGTSSGSIIMTMNLRELRHFFKLRRAKDAQWEIRQLADQMYQLVYAVVPTLFGGSDE